MNKPLPPIAQTLSNLKLVSYDDIAAICRDNRTVAEIIGAAFSKELITSEQLSKELSRRFGAPLFDLKTLNERVIPRELINTQLMDKHLIVPIHKRGNVLFVALLDPTNKTALDQLSFSTGLQIFPVQAELQPLLGLIELINTSSDVSLEEFIDGEESDVDTIDRDTESDDSDEDMPIIRYVNKVLIDAINRGASDIHVEPFEHELRVRYRIDGILHKIDSQAIALAPRITARIKIISRLDIAERRVPQDGRMKLKVSRTKAFDFRVNTLPTVHGEKVVMRILDSSAANLDLNSLGFTPTQLHNYLTVVQRPYGMVLITGPTGSGKTVTLYSALNMLNEPTKNISTVEDPVEIQLPGITQVNINEKANLNFASALRAFLRQDPDILMLGEIRDLETAEIAIKASQTGHMVLSTLHTNDAPSTLTRLLNMGVPAFNVASAVHLIVAQRLVRRLCSKCKESLELPEKALIEAGFDESEFAGLELFQPNRKGCDNCTEGYKGRAGVFQVMPVSEKIKTIIMEGGTEQNIEKAASAEGTLDLRASGLLKVKEGITSLEEIERVTNS